MQGRGMRYGVFVKDVRNEGSEVCLYLTFNYRRQSLHHI